MFSRLMPWFAFAVSFSSNAEFAANAQEAKSMKFIDAHVHVWTPDTARYSLATGFKKEDMKPRSEERRVGKECRL